MFAYRTPGVFRATFDRMPKAIWNDEVIAESDDTVVVEGNYYFPRASLREDL